MSEKRLRPRLNRGTLEYSTNPEKNIVAKNFVCEALYTKNSLTNNLVKYDIIGVKTHTHYGAKIQRGL